MPCLIPASPVHAQKSGGDTPLILLGSSTTTGDEAMRKRDDAIVSTRVVYALMARPDQDVSGIDGKIGASSKVLARKDTQLFGVTSPDGARKTYCTVDHKPKGALEGVFVINADKHTCFVDTDGDSKFDHSYDLRTKYSSLIPIYYDVETVGNPLTTPVGYTSIDPEQCQLPMWLDVYVQKISNGGHTVMIGVRMRTDKGSAVFTYAKRLDLNAGSRTIQMLGARVVLSPVDQTRVSVKVVYGIERQPFSTSRPDRHIQVIMI